MIAADTSVVWFRRDLRLHDLEALHDASTQSQTVVPLFVLDERLLRRRADKRLAFFFRSLQALAADLQALGASLVIRSGDPLQVVPHVATEVGAARVFASREYTSFGRRRDAAVARLLEAAGSRLELRAGVLVAEPGDIVAKSGNPFVRYAPFRGRWLEQQPSAPLPPPSTIRSVRIGGERFPEALPPLPEGCPEPGERAARARMARWAAGGISSYARLRNQLDSEGTSRLSQDLRWGLISPRELRGAIDPEAGGSYLAELAWRDFAYHVAWHRGGDDGKRFEPRPVEVPWRNDPQEIAAWKEGLTGYPVIDAAMRQLREAGFISNRARMLAASFLTRHLLGHWSIGEDHFLEHLIDGDPAVNRYNWEWVASVGVDAQPAFRVFNPVTQGQRFDGRGTYVRTWVPELAALEGPAIHEPWTLDRAASEAAGVRIGSTYPAPIVDHAMARERALAAFRP